MVAIDTIREFSQRIGREFGAERVVLFGSYARGTVTEDSDVDLLVRTPEKVRQRMEMGDDFMREILEEGKVLYEADNG